MAGLAVAAGSVASVFEVEFADRAGGRCHGPLGELWNTPFERVAPVRSLVSFRGHPGRRTAMRHPRTKRASRRGRRDGRSQSR